MIDFACKKFDLKEIVKCSLGLTKSEFHLFEYLLMHSSTGFQSAELAKALKLDLTTVQKGVKNLYEKRILYRTQKNIDQGGYIYYYQIKNKEEVKKRIMGTIKNWVSKVESEMKEWK